MNGEIHQGVVGIHSLSVRSKGEEIPGDADVLKGPPREAVTILSVVLSISLKG